jgi:hypothetical protein
VELIGSMGPVEEEYGKKGVAFLLVNAFDEPAAARALMDKVGKDRPWAFADEKALQALGIHMAPNQVLVDAQGKVAWTCSFGTMFDGMDAIRKALDAVAKPN